MLFNENGISEKIKSNQRKRQYRHMLEEQIRDNKKRKIYDHANSRKKIKTQQFQTLSTVRLGSLVSPHHHRYHSLSSDLDSQPNYYYANGNVRTIPNLKQKKLIQKSIFLPSVNRLQEVQRMNYDRSQSNYSRLALNSIDSQTETLQTLTECELIIENLKRLAKVQSKNLDMKIRANESNRRYNQQDHLQSRGPNFFRLIETNADNEIQHFRSKQLNNQKAKNKNSIRQAKLNEDKNKDKKNEIQSKDFQTIQSAQNKSQQSDQIKTEQINKKQQFEIKKMQLEFQKERKKQKFLMKYLGKAKIGGVKLHQKIVEYKTNQRNNIKKSQNNNKQIKLKEKEKHNQVQHIQNIPNQIKVNQNKEYREQLEQQEQKEQNNQKYQCIQFDNSQKAFNDENIQES